MEKTGSTKKRWLQFLIILIVLLAANWIIYSMVVDKVVDQTHDGFAVLPLPSKCELVFYDKTYQTKSLVILQCRDKETVRLWPLPIKSGYFEQWEDEINPQSDN